MATWATILARCKRQYALSPGVNDGLLSDELALDSLNEALADMARTSGGWRTTQVIDLSPSGVSLATGTLQPLEGSIRADYDGDGVFELPLLLCSEAELRSQLRETPLGEWPESTPAAVYVVRTFTGGVQLHTFPPTDVTREDALKLDTLSVPEVVDDSADAVPLMQAEESLVIPYVCRAWARAELADGNTAAPVGYWDGLAKGALATYQAGVAQTEQSEDVREIQATDPDDWY